MTSTTNRARTSSQRGVVLIISLVLAVLYFALMQLLLIDSSRALNEAQRFRARIVAATLAESAAEMAAEQIVTKSYTPVPLTTDFQGTKSGEMRIVSPGQFEITAHGTSIGTMTQEATVTIQGTISGTKIAIDFCEHTQ